MAAVTARISARRSRILSLSDKSRRWPTSYCMPRPPSLLCVSHRGASLGRSPLDLVLLQPVLQSIELRLPIVAVVVDPDGGFIQRTGVEAAGADAAAAFLADKASPDQNLDVARDRLRGYRVGL